MSRISSATTQQSVSISSLTENLETAEIAVPAQKELPQPADVHATAEKQNALTRQSENNLTAMLQKERLTVEGGARAGVDMPLGGRHGGAMGRVDNSLTTQGGLGGGVFPGRGNGVAVENSLTRLDAVGGGYVGNGDDGGASGGVIGDRGDRGAVDQPVTIEGGARAGVDM
ncbi:MAG TPA: hypothetical protein VLH08_17005 [Acidobacteriota bacterium]|nr:hypothetical protein [Acidobacteriota bacterium]